MRASRAEPGCKAYVPCVDTEDPSSILFFEEYDDKAAFEAWTRSEEFRRAHARAVSVIPEAA